MRAFNLIPADDRGGASSGAGKSGGAAFVVLGLLGVLAIFALLYGNARHRISSQRDEVAGLTTRAQEAQAQAAKLAPYVSFAALHEQRVQAVDQLVDSRFDWAHAFHEVGRVLPNDASLSSLAGTIGATAGATTSSSPATSSSTASSAATASATVDSATPPGSVPAFTLSGCATNQTEVALTLDRLRLIDGVSEVTLQSSTKTAGGGGGGAGGCSGKEAAFAMKITFDPLPSASATSSQSTTSTASASAGTQPTTSTGGPR
jgi:Tfp pilus assembly protein PilN